MPGLDLAHLSLENRELFPLLYERDRRYVFEPERWLPILRPCRVKVLLVADGGLEFSLNDFGLRTFVRTLQSMPAFYVRFDITCAHIRNVSDDGVIAGDFGLFGVTNGSPSELKVGGSSLLSALHLPASDEGWHVERPGSDGVVLLVKATVA
jgi:hypothetical protein